MIINFEEHSIFSCNKPDECKFKYGARSEEIKKYDPTYNRKGVNITPNKMQESCKVTCIECGKTWDVKRSIEIKGDYPRAWSLGMDESWDITLLPDDFELILGGWGESDE